MKEKPKILVMLLVALVTVSASSADIIFVDPDATGANDGSSWADAFNSLQDALAVAQYDDEIRAAQGIYKPDQGVGVVSGDREATFQLINGVSIKGGYAGFGEPDPNARDIDAYETILSGDIGIIGESMDNCYHVVTSSNTDTKTILDGFTITAGNANGYYQNNYGGGMYNDKSNTTLVNCTFSINLADERGGGMFNYQSSPKLTNCTFIGNSSELGGGIHNRFGNPTLMNCMFTENSSEYDGGGMYNYENSPTLIKCTFTENKSEYGGGLCNNYSNPILKNCIFSGNVSYKRGGAIYNSLFRSMSVTNCTFTGNRALEGGGGMYLNPPPPPAGASEATSNYITSTITNCIFWDNLPEQIVNRNSPRPRINYCDVQGGRSGVVEPHGAPSCWGEGNIDANPRFVRPGYWEPLLPPPPPPPPPPPGTQLSISAASYTSYTPYYIWVEGNYHLLPDSPCIDAGDPGYVAEPNETDLDGKPRVLDGNGDAIAVVDMGAYEFPPPTPYEIAVIKVEKAIFEKIKTLEQIDAMLEKDWTAYQALEELLESGDYGDSKKRDITKAMQQIHSSIQHGELSKMEIQRSIEKLLYSLSTLGYGPQPPGSNWPPYVTIIQPEDGAEFSPSQTIEIEADVLDFDGWVVSVEFFANGNKIAEDTNGTDGWTINWSDHPEGSYKLTATATDDKGAATTSSAVEIIVVFLPPPPPT